MHSHTLLVMAAILMCIVTMVLAVMWHFNRRIPGLGSWGLAYLSGFALCGLLLAHGRLHEAVFVAAVQTLTFLVAYLNLASARAYAGRPPLPRRYVAGALTGVVALSLYFTIGQAHPGARFAVSSLAAGSLFLLSGRALATGSIAHYPARYLFALASGAHGVFLLLRPLLFSPGSAGLFDATNMLTISQFVVLESIVALMLMAFCILMLANEHSAAKLRRLAERDPLTDVFNRRSFLNLFDKALSQGARSARSVAVLLVDLDRFKSINDSVGHKGGDEALRHFVRTAVATLRNEDVIGRFGGEEFAILLAGSGLHDALATAERLRAAIEANPLQLGGATMVLTVSIGVASSCRHDDADAMLDRADKAMYAAKHKGRNRVETLDQESGLRLPQHAALPQAGR
ncbi:GGDEF domain-containing protein [Thauera humireducens]|uniref:diguanylate cyclase n=1 Tax=Thauera humireducens TaxID=1134435 RepID=A0A140IE11_9RHOO|nr:GGDEF domain-containing protein [Thauera humireducens]AMO35986.1 hypothetical protein AC731_002930 [Thauera humireducens]